MERTGSQQTRPAFTLLTDNGTTMFYTMVLITDPITTTETVPVIDKENLKMRPRKRATKKDTKTCVSLKSIRV